MWSKCPFEVILILWMLHLNLHMQTVGNPCRFPAPQQTNEICGTVFCFSQLLHFLGEGNRSVLTSITLQRTATFPATFSSEDLATLVTINYTYAYAYACACHASAIFYCSLWPILFWSVLVAISFTLNVATVGLHCARISRLDHLETKNTNLHFIFFAFCFKTSISGRHVFGYVLWD